MVVVMSCYWYAAASGFAMNYLRLDCEKEAAAET